MTERQIEALAYQILNGVHPKVFQKKPNIENVFNFQQIQKNYKLSDKQLNELKTKMQKIKK